MQCSLNDNTHEHYTFLFFYWTSNWKQTMFKYFCYWDFKKKLRILDSTKCPISKVKLATLVKGDPKAPFSIATSPKCRGGCYSIRSIAPFYLWSSPYSAECEAVFGMTQPGIEPRFPGPLLNTLLIKPMAQWKIPHNWGQMIKSMYLPTPPHGQNVTQSQFLSGV